MCKKLNLTLQSMTDKSRLTKFYGFPYVLFNALNKAPAVNREVVTLVVPMNSA